MIPAQDLAQHIRSILTRREEAKIIGIHDARPVQPQEALEVGDRVARVVYASSQLGVRHALAQGADDLLVVVTPLTLKEIGADVGARLLRQKLYPLDHWDTVKTLVQAAQLDDRLRARQALARALVRHAGDTAYTPVRAGVLTEREAWRRLLCERFELPENIEALESWIEWSMTKPQHLIKLLREQEAEPELAKELLEYMRVEVSEAFALVWARWRADQTQPNPGLKLVLIGLARQAAREALEANAQDNQDIHITMGQLYQDLGAQSKDQRPHLETITDACVRAYARLGAEQERLLHELVRGLDAYFKALDAAELLPFSRVSHLGWETRQARLARALSHEGGQDAKELGDALAWLKAHDLAHDPSQQHLLEQLTLATKLAYKLSDPAWRLVHDEPSVMAAQYIDSSSFEDLIRESLSTTDFGHKGLQDAVRGLLERAAAQRAQDNARFAQGLALALKQQSAVAGALGMQDVLHKVVGPVTQRCERALLIVLDGMSWAQLRALLKDAAFGRWTPWALERDRGVVPLLATLPSVTNLSRVSLLTGEVNQGGQSQEQQGFSKNHRLLQQLGPQTKIKLFHKAEVDEEGIGGVSAAVMTSVLDPKMSLVGVVLNTFDDQLSGAQQLSLKWSVDAIPSLRSLMTLAQQSERALFLASDHGHIWDDRSEGLSAPTTHARYRPNTEQALRDGEVVIESYAVKKYTGEQTVVLLHDERLRYTGRQRGYHGGASMPEVISPLLVLTHDAKAPGAQFAQLITAEPDWWHMRPPQRGVSVPEHISTTTTTSSDASAGDDAAAALAEVSAPPAPQLDLLALPLEPAPEEARHAQPSEAAAEDEDIAWIVRLFESKSYQYQQQQRAQKIPPEDVYRILVTLCRNDNAAHISQLARALSRADNRASRVVSTLSQVLNIDGYPILNYDRHELLVKLDRAMLFKQFGLEER